MPADAEGNRHVARIETAVSEGVQQVAVLAVQNFGRVGEPIMRNGEGVEGRGRIVAVRLVIDRVIPEGAARLDAEGSPRKVKLGEKVEAVRDQARREVRGAGMKRGLGHGPPVLVAESRRVHRSQ